MFDTLKFSKTLRAAGMPIEKADAITEAFRDSLKTTVVPQYALTQSLIQMEQRIISRLGIVMVVAIGVVAATLKLVQFLRFMPLW